MEYTSNPYMSEKNTPASRSASADRRSRQRMPVRVPVKVRHEGAECQGLTRDLSSTGIFLYSEPGIKAGSKLELVIMLPPGLGLGPGGWTLCEASVVRVEGSGDKGMGIAATFDRIARLPEII
ncbi:MAG: PilZ domain-containing protein [Terriglobales bacterium]